jgi:hypothetical protein
MLNPRIHSLDHFRSLTRFTVRHDWRMPETGLVFRVTNATYQTVAILPKNERQDRHRAQVILRQLGTTRTFTEPLDELWSGMDRGAFGSPRYSRLFVRWNPLWVEKAIKRHARKQAKRRAALRRFLVAAGLVVEGGVA